jgi:HAD superfamily hydrolase (TIGR01450 family)
MSNPTGTLPKAPAERAPGVPAPGAASAPVGGLAFDLDGTVYLSSQLLPGALELLGALAHAGVPYVFATNNSSKSGAQYLEHLRALGLGVERTQLLTSNDVAVAYLRGAGLVRPYLVATPTVEEEYRAAGIEPTTSGPDAVLLTFDTTLTYDKLRRASDLIRSGLPYFATHPDSVCPTPSGPIPDCGAFAALLFEATGVRPVVLGKPEAHMARAIQSRLGLPARRIAFVGDRLYTDVRMANDHGFQAVLTLTGEASRDDLAASPYAPGLVVEDLRDLHAHLRRVGTVA